MAFGRKNKKEAVNFEKIDTLIGQDTFFHGSLTASGTIRIDGEFKGDLRAKGDLVIGDTGRLESTIEARNVLIAGQVKGNIQSFGRIELAASGKLFGDIKVKNLIIEEGAIFKGNCQMETNIIQQAGKEDSAASQLFKSVSSATEASKYDHSKYDPAKYENKYEHKFEPKLEANKF